MKKQLPARPSLEHLETEANDLLRGHALVETLRRADVRARARRRDRRELPWPVEENAETLELEERLRFVLGLISPKG